MTTIQKLKAYPWHPYLVCLYCFVKAIADLQISTHYWFGMLGLLLIYWSITGVLQGIFRFIWSSNTPGSIALSALLFLNFFLLPLHKTINYIFPIVERVRFSFLILATLWLILAVFLWVKKNKNYKLLSQYLIIVLLLYSAFDSSKWCYNTLFSAKQIRFEPSTILKKKNYNIYLIVPDGYASNESLLKYWHFDNNEFLADLKNKGFFIPQNPHSNYRYTIQSISTMLNLNYWQTSPTELFMETQIADNALMNFLSSQKYHCRIFDFTNHDYTFNTETTTVNIKKYLYLQSSIYFLASTFDIYIDVENLPSLPNNNSVFDRTREILSSSKDTLSKQFAYSHIMLTHPPFLYPKGKQTDLSLEELLPDPLYIKWVAGSDNKNRTLGSYGDSLLMRQYLLKVKQTNDSIQTLLNQPWTSIKENSIVIIMSDHGLRILPGQPIDFQAEAYSNFCAVYFPDKDYSTLTDTITPINVLRMTVNKVLGTNLSYLPDKTNLK